MILWFSDVVMTTHDWKFLNLSLSNHGFKTFLALRPKAAELGQVDCLVVIEKHVEIYDVFSGKNFFRPFVRLCFCPTNLH